MNSAYRLVVMASILAALAVLAGRPVRADDQDDLQGTWRATFAEVGGVEATPAQQKRISVSIKGNAFTLNEGGGSETVYFRLNQKAKPRVIEFWRKNQEGKTLWHGIYQFDGTNLRICWGPAGQARPRTFNSKASNEHRWYVFRR
jgi:uncharacterized protein (TIGR03067 family)